MARPICIVGTGYVGMACMIGFATLGFRVHGYDIASDRIARLRKGVAPYREAGIEEALREHIDNGRIDFFDSLPDAASGSDIIVVAVGTPSLDGGSADLSALFAAVNALAEVEFEAWPTIVIRSTVPPGTTDTLFPLVHKWGQLIYAPEFLREGAAVKDFLNPDRIVIGSDSAAEAVPYAQLFESLQKPLVFTSRTNAELIKCASNAFLALKISFANEVANLCDALGAGSDDVLRAIGYDRRIGTAFLKPGIGFGGPCFEKDVKSIHHVAEHHGTGRELFAATLRVNESQPRRIVDMLEEEAGSLRGLTIGVWGLTFKAGTDDTRDSLALRIVHDLAARGAKSIVFDPAVHVAPLPEGSRLVRSALEAADCDVLLVLTEWPEFQAIPPASYAGSVRRGIVVDGRNILDPHRVAAAGLLYRGVGRSGAGIAEAPMFAAAVAV